MTWRRRAVEDALGRFGRRLDVRALALVPALAVLGLLVAFDTVPVYRDSTPSSEREKGERRE